MTEREMVNIIEMLYMAYPTFNMPPGKNIKDVIDFWYKFFVNDNYNIVETAVQWHISTNKWPPSIAEIREQMVKLTRHDLIPPDIAWKAVKDYLYIRDSYIKLPPLIAKVVETIGTSTLKEQRNGYDKQMFMELYTPAYQRELEKAKLPKVLSDRIAKLDEALGGETIKAISQISEAREKEIRMYDEALYRQYTNLDKITLNSDLSA